MRSCVKLRRTWYLVLLRGFPFGFMPLMLAAVMIPWGLAAGNGMGLAFGLAFLGIASLAMSGGGAICDGQIVTRALVFRRRPVPVASIDRLIVAWSDLLYMGGRRPNIAFELSDGSTYRFLPSFLCSLSRLEQWAGVIEQHPDFRGEVVFPWSRTRRAGRM